MNTPISPPILPRDADGFLHAVALSGGKDSSAMAIALREREPHIPHPYFASCASPSAYQEFENERLPRGFNPDATRKATCRACTL